MYCQQAPECMPHLAGQLVLTCQGRLAQEDLTAELESATYVCFRLQRLCAALSHW